MCQYGRIHIVSVSFYLFVVEAVDDYGIANLEKLKT